MPESEPTMDYRQVYLDSLFTNQRPHEKALFLLGILQGLITAFKAEAEQNNSTIDAYKNVHQSEQRYSKFLESEIKRLKLENVKLRVKQ